LLSQEGDYELTETKNNISRSRLKQKSEKLSSILLKTQKHQLNQVLPAVEAENFHLGVKTVNA